MKGHAGKRGHNASQHCKAIVHERTERAAESEKDLRDGLGSGPPSNGTRAPLKGGREALPPRYAVLCSWSRERDVTGAGRARCAEQR